MTAIEALLRDPTQRLLLDGGLGTWLEAKGVRLDDPLWSARVLVDEPHLIAEVHDDYLAAGADVVTTATYQASYPGFARAGFKAVETTHHLLNAVALARRAAAKALASRPPGAPPPLVAASIGSYAGYLADGSEFTGRLGAGVDTLKSFHRSRLAVLAQSDADLLAIETIPNLDEVRAIVELLRDFPFARGWLALVCRDGRSLSSGEAVEDALAIAEDSEQLIAVGFNCTAPCFIDELLERAANATSKPLLAYPNSGETFTREEGWRDDPGVDAFTRAARHWIQGPVRFLGGCCRTTPTHVAALRRLWK